MRAIDTEPHPGFRNYSSGNFAEVAPSRWSIMSWSLVGDGVERGMRATTLRVLPAANWAMGSYYVFVGYFSCRPYHNLSALCQLAQELPGLSCEDVTRAYFEGVDAPARDRGSYMPLWERLCSLPRAARELHGLHRRRLALETEVAVGEQRAATALASGSAVALGATVESMRRLLDRAWELHYATTSSLIPASALQRALGRRVMHDWDELEPLLNRPEELPWRRLLDGAVGGVLAHSDFLNCAFYEVGDEHEPWRSHARAFTPPPPREVHEMVSGEGLAEVIWRMRPHARVSGIELITRVVLDTLRAREESKALAMRLLHIFRRCLPPLAGELGIEGDGWTYLRVGELLAPTYAPSLAELVQSRRSECEEALAEDTPDQLSFPEVFEERAPAVRLKRRARGVSPGIASGVVRTPESLSLSDGVGRDRPMILVCDSADAGVQVLLPSLAGLITLRGSMLSHIASLAREYGVPAVVNHPLAAQLRDGQEVVLDGSTGEVEVIT